MIDSATYISVGSQIVQSISDPAARANVDFSYLAWIPGLLPAAQSTLLARVTESLPYVSIYADGTPYLVTPPGYVAPVPTPAPAPDPTPTPTAKVPYVSRTGTCAPGYQPGAELVSHPRTIDEQVRDAVSLAAQSTYALVAPVAGVEGPSPALRVTVNDSLYLDYTSTLVGGFNLVCNTRIQTADGQIVVSTQQWLINDPGGNSFVHGQFTVPLIDSWLVGFTILADESQGPGDQWQPQRGEVWISCQLVTGGTGGGVGAVLVADYLVGGAALAWPPSRVTAWGTGRGADYYQEFTPALLTTCTFSPSAGQIVRLRSLTFRLATSAVAGTRSVLLSFTPYGSTSLTQFSTTAGQAASLKYWYTFAEGIAPGLQLGTTANGNAGRAADAVVQVPIPGDLFTDNTGGYRVYISSPQTGDAVSGLSFYHESWARPTFRSP